MLVGPFTTAVNVLIVQDPSSSVKVSTAWITKLWNVIHKTNMINDSTSNYCPGNVLSLKLALVRHNLVHLTPTLTGQSIHHRDFSDDVRYKPTQTTVFGIVSYRQEVHAVMFKQTFNTSPLPFFINSDGMSPVNLYQLHTGHIGITIADVDHVAKRNWPFLFGSVLIEIDIVGNIQYTLVDPKQELCLGRVVDRVFGPTGDAVYVVEELTGKDLTEMTVNTRTFNYFLSPDEII